MEDLVDLLNMCSVGQELGREPRRVESAIAGDVNILVLQLSDQILLFLQVDLLM